VFLGAQCNFLPNLDSNFLRYCSNILKVWWTVLCGFCSKFRTFSNSERFL